MAKLSVEQALSKAKSHTKKGELAEAQALYATILKAFPNNKKAQQGLTALGGGQLSAAEQGPPQAVINQLMSLYKQGQLKLVVDQTQDLTVQFPKAITLWNMLGASAAKLGKFDQAILAFEETIALNPKQASAHYNLGNALKDKGQFEEAIDAYTKALELKPDYEAARNNLVFALKSQGKPGQEQHMALIKNYTKLYTNKAENADKQFEMALELQKQGKFDEAVSSYTKAISLWPDYANAYNNMGNALQEQGKLEEAIEAYNKALAIKPDYANAYNNLGNVLQEQSKLEKAIEAYNKALTIKPDYVKAYNNMGFVLQEQGKPEEAIESYNKALTIKPDDADARYNMSFCKLQTVDWKEGIALRSMRMNMKHFRDYARDFNAPHWDGTSPLEGKTLLIWGEQGPGDMIIWASCFEYYIAKCCKIIVECSPKLICLFQLSFPQIEFRAERKNIKNNTEDFDYQVPMETLFGYACLSGFSNNDQKQYLYPDQERVNYWSNRLKLISDKPCVGISWKSPVVNLKRAKNYANLSYWRPVFKNTNVTFVNLQSTDFQKDLNKIHKDFGIDVVHFGEINHYDDLAEVAALSKALDMSISIATAVATITAGVGTTTIIPTWRQSSWNNLLLNSRGPDLEMLYRNSWENWDKTFNKVAEKVSCLVQ